MDRELKIELINLYEKLMSHKLPVKTASESTRDAIQKEFTTWVESRLEFLLNGKEASHITSEQLSAEDLQILKHWIEDYKSKRGTKTSAQPRKVVQGSSQQVILPEATSNKDILKELGKNGLNLVDMQDDPNLPQY